MPDGLPRIAPTAPADFSAAVPRSIRERGVAVPFTAPALGGARMRPGPNLHPELLLANPGGCGVVVLPWRGVTALHQPTLYDDALFAALATIEDPSPAQVAASVAEIARQGLAGRAAAASAAGRLARDQASLGDALPTLVAPLRGRLPRVAAGIAGLHAALQRRPPPVTGDAGADVAWLLAACRSALAAARATLDAALAALRDGPALVRAWAEHPGPVKSLLERPQFLLDGWDWIVLLWQAQPSAAELVAELADLVPAIPHEAAGWAAECRPAAGGLLRPGRQSRRPDTIDPIEAEALLRARNERLLARLLGAP